MKKRKSKKKKEDKKIVGLQELSGYSVGQLIYCFRYPDKLLVRGKIKNLFKTDTHEFADVVDEITGQFRAALLEDIIENPTKSQVNSANTKIATKIRKSKEKK